MSTRVKITPRDTQKIPTQTYLDKFVCSWREIDHGFKYLQHQRPMHYQGKAREQQIGIDYIEALYLKSQVPVIVYFSLRCFT